MKCLRAYWLKCQDMINYDTKPKITFSLDPILQAYCRYIFNTPAYAKYIILSRKQDLGKLINSVILTCDIPPKRPFISNPVTFILPVTNANQYILRYRFLYLPRWAEEKIQDNIDYEFRVWVKARFEKGYEEKYEQKEIVEAILRGLNMRNNAANFDAIKKIDYRNRRKKEEKRFSKLCEAVKAGSL